MTNSITNIELRSEKVRNIVGKIPPALLRMGISIITLIIIALLIAAYFIPYPEKLSFPVNLQSMSQCDTCKSNENIYGLSYIPFGKFNRLQQGQMVAISLQDYPSNRYGFIAGQILKIYPIPERKRGYRVEISLTQGLITTNAIEVNYTPFLTGEAVVVLSNESFLKRFLHSIMRK